MARKTRLNIKIFYQPRKNIDAKLLLDSETDFEHTAIFVTMKEESPFYCLKLQVDSSELKAEIATKQSSKLKKIEFYEVISEKVKISKEEIIREWGDFLEFKNLRKFQKKYDIGFNFYGAHRESYYDAQLIYQSLSPDFNVILSDDQAKNMKVKLSDTVILITDKSYLRKYFCTKNDSCGYTTRNLYDLNKHMKTCTDQTHFSYKEKEFGNPRDIKAELIDLNIISNETKIYNFLTFDIETLLRTDSFQFGQSFSKGTSIVNTIGYFFNEQEKGVFVRESNSEPDGDKLVQKFLQKMIKIQETHFESLSPQIKNYHQLLIEKLKDKSLSVSEKSKLIGHLNLLKEIFKINIVGFNSGRFDLPIIFEHLLKSCDLSEINVIKKGSSFFSLEYKGLCFRDASNYIPGTSLAKFCETFQVPSPKGIFPYEYFADISQMRETQEYPPISAFFTSLKEVDKTTFVEKFEKLFVHFLDFSELVNFFGLKGFAKYNDLLCFPRLTETEKESLLNQIEICPDQYFEAKNNYDLKIQSGEFTSFLDELIFYNLHDCEILYQALENYDLSLQKCFAVNLLSKVSLPALSEHILWSNYDSSDGTIFSFSEKFGHLNEKIRAGLLGGPTICFHRHCEIDATEKYHESVHFTPSGEPYKKFLSYDFNG